MGEVRNSDGLKNIFRCFDFRSLQPRTSNSFKAFLRFTIGRLRVSNSSNHNAMNISLENFIIFYVIFLSFASCLDFHAVSAKYTKAETYFWIHEIKEEKLHKQEGTVR